MAYIHHDTCAVYVTSRIGTIGMPANRSIRAYKRTHEIASFCELLGLYWFVMMYRGRWGLLILDLFLLVFLPWISASVTDTLLFASVTSWLSSNPISRTIFSPWPLTPTSLSNKIIKWYSLILPVSHAKFVSLKPSFLVSQHPVSVDASYLKNRPYTAINPSPWKVQLEDVHTCCRKPRLRSFCQRWFEMICHLPGNCLDMHASLGCGVFSIVLFTLLYNFWETFVELGPHPEIPVFR